MSRAEVNGKRLYETPSGEKLASVTTILDATKSEDQKAALDAWKQAVGETKAKEIVTEAANRGTRMHKYLEDYLLTGEFGKHGTNPHSKISWAMASEIVKHAFPHIDEFWGSEVGLYYEGLYAGTTDCTGVWKGKEAILDFKQTNKPKQKEWIDSYFHQLAAYAEAHNKMFNTNIKTGVILMCAKPATNTKLEMISVPQYQEFVIELAEFDKYTHEWWDKVEKFYSIV